MEVHHRLTVRYHLTKDADGKHDVVVGQGWPLCGGGSRRGGHVVVGQGKYDVVSAAAVPVVSAAVPVVSAAVLALPGCHLPGCHAVWLPKEVWFLVLEYLHDEDFGGVGSVKRLVIPSSTTHVQASN